MIANFQSYPDNKISLAEQIWNPENLRREIDP